MSALTLFQNLEDVRILQAMTYSSCALLVWDYLLTLDDEMTYIWGNPGSVVKYLFLGNRYVNLLVQPFNVSQMAGVLLLDSTATCLAFSWALSLTKLWSYGSVHFLVLLRVWILYGCTLKITIGLMVAFTLYLCASIATLVYILGAMHFGLTAYGEACLGELPSLSWLIWIIGCILEVCLFGLTIFMLSLYRHAIIFLLANILDNVLNIIAWTVFANSLLYDIANSLTVVLVNITGQRLAIDLRRLQIQKDLSRSEISREVEFQLAAFDDIPLVPVALSAGELP